MSLNTYFDKIFCINLDRRPDRWEDCLKQFKLYNIKDVERFSAYDGLKANLEVEPSTSGVCGCARSHQILLQKAADGPWNRVLILEDDFHILTYPDLIAGGFTADSQVLKTFLSAPTDSLSARFDAMAQHVPDDWDILYLGGGYGQPPIARVHKHVVRCAGVHTTSSYAVTRARAKKLLLDIRAGASSLHGTIIGGIDSVYYNFAQDHDRYNFYIFQPRLMIQRKSKSDINGRLDSYLFSMTDPVHENMV